MKGKPYEKKYDYILFTDNKRILNAQYQVSQEQAVTAAINTIKYNNIYPDVNQDYCNFSLDLSSHYDKYYNDYNILYPQPYNNIPQTATVLRSVPNSNSYPASWRTIPAGITTEYVAHEEIILHVSRQDYKQYR